MDAYIESEIRRNITSTNCFHEDYRDVINAFHERGFWDTKATACPDLSFGERFDEGKVDTVEINGNDTFDEDSVFPTNAKIRIRYHTFMKAQPPLSSKKARKLKVADVERSFLVSSGNSSVWTQTYQYIIIAHNHISPLTPRPKYAIIPPVSSRGLPVSHLARLTLPGSWHFIRCVERRVYDPSLFFAAEESDLEVHGYRCRSDDQRRNSRPGSSRH